MVEEKRRNEGYGREHKIERRNGRREGMEEKDEE